MDTILNSDEFVEVNGRQYLNPQVALDESNSFIDNLRATQAQQNQQIAQDTAALGTSIPSVQGGLGTNTPANMSYFTSRLQTPQTSSAVANLRATAQAAALNQALQNEQEIWKKRYNDAYRAYQRRASSSGGNGGTQSPSSDAGQGDVTTTATDLEGRGTMSLTDEDFERGGYYVQDMNTNRYGGHDIIWVSSSGQNIRIPQLSDGSYATSNIKEFVRTHGGSSLPFIGGE